jgi:hypothetical protein
MANSDESFDEQLDHLHGQAEVELDDDFTEPRNSRSLLYAIIWQELPYFLMLSLAIFGIGYVSFTGNPSDRIWKSLVPVFGVMCIIGGWRRAVGKDERWRIIWTQTSHWLAFLVAMNLIYLPEVRNIANNNAAGLNLMTILALATFVAGVHAQAWQICGVGLILALAAPMAAWIEQSALLALISVVGVVFVVGVVWLAMRREKRRLSEEF